MVFWWIAIIAIILLLIRFVVRRDKDPIEKTALEILKERYARGEISKEEFDRKKKDIEG